MLNSICIMGRLTAAVELRRTNTGNAVCGFALAVNRYAKAGEQAQTDFIDCVAWGKTAEFICKYFTKGQQMAVRGRLQTRNYEDRSGNKRKAVEVVCKEAFFADSKRTDDGGYGQPGAFDLGKVPKSDFDPLADDDMDDVPFF